LMWTNTYDLGVVMLNSIGVIVWAETLYTELRERVPQQTYINMQQTWIEVLFLGLSTQQMCL